MIDINMLFMSLKASWISTLLTASPTVHCWSQIPYGCFKQFLDCNTKLVFNFDFSVHFDHMNCLYPFYKEVFICYNSVLVMF